MEESCINSNCRVVIIGGSAGSLEVLMKVVPLLQPDPSVAVVIVIHRKGGSDTTLEDLFEMKSSIPVRKIEDKVMLLPGYLYVAPANYHLLFEKDGRVSLDISEKVNYSRPSIDVSFQSAADVYGQKLTAILLSGSNSDGTAGLETVHDNRGTTVVQDPESAGMPYMPQSAIDQMTPDYILGPEQLAEFIDAI